MIGLLVLKSRPTNTQELLDALRSIQPAPPAGPPVPAPGPPPVTGGVGRDALIAYVRSTAPQHNLDASAVLAVAEQEGLGGGIGDGGLAYGPWQDHLTEFAGRPWYGYGRNNADVQAWAWSTAGVDYVLSQMVAAGAAGLHGVDAIAAIVHGYERSTDQAGVLARAVSNYGKWAA